MSRVFYQEAGTGPPIIFLHGFCDTHELWSDFIQPFLQKYKVITPDLPGFGQSESLPLPFTVDHAATALLNWIGEKKIERPIVIGHSLGGYVTLAMMEQAPQVLAAFGLFHSTARPDTAERKEIRNKVIEFVKNKGVQPYVDTLVPGLFFDKKNPHATEVHRRASQTKPDVLMGYAAAMRDRPDRTVLLKSEIPKLMIGGMEDTLISIDTLRDQHKMAKNEVFFELEGVGHMGFFEAKLKCQAIITSFTDGIYR